MLYAARKRKNINLVNASADFIPFPYEYFSKVMSIVAFHHFSDQDSALEEIEYYLFLSLSIYYTTCSKIQYVK
jgi:ubiquinone/menaquinone biosynthesis C-methylase UbiE